MADNGAKGRQVALDNRAERAANPALLYRLRLLTRAARRRPTREASLAADAAVFRHVASCPICLSQPKRRLRPPRYETDLGALVQPEVFALVDKLIDAWKDEPSTLEKHQLEWDANQAE